MEHDGPYAGNALDAAPRGAGTSAQAASPEPWSQTRIIGTRTPRVDGYERASGSATYPTDVVLPGMLHAAILRSPHAHARVTRVDFAAAARLPGLRAVLSGESPGAAIPWYRGPQGFRSTLFDPHVRYAGEEVAAVAADTPWQAHDALRAIRVEYDVLPFAVSAGEALKSGAPPVFEGDNLVRPPVVYERGDVAKGFAEADVIVEETFTTAVEIHVPMERHGCVAKWDGPRLTVWESTQGVYAIQSQLAEALDLPLASVRVICPYMGGGFGSKLEAGKHVVIAALLARQTGRPVRLVLSREETMLSAGNRPAARMTVKAGAKRDGTLTALTFSCTASGGAYSDGGTSLVDWQARDLYRCPNVRTEATDVFTHAGPSRPFRAPGHPQGSWALEQTIDALAMRLGVDPVDLRLRNVPAVSQARGDAPYTSTGLRQCLEDGARTFGWGEARSRRPAAGHLRRGVGVAAGLWIGGGGSPPSTVIVKLFADGSANLNMGASDLGTGTRTVMAMVVAEELGVALDRIQVENADTGTTQFATPSGGSKTVPTEAPAVRDAALDVERQVVELAADQLKVDPASLDLRDGRVVRSDGTDALALADITALWRRGVVVGIGRRGPNPAGQVVNPFAAHFAEVEVNTRTGEVTVLRVLAAQDSGRVMNRLTYDNQVFGGIAMGLGLALTEARVMDEVHAGRVLSANLHDYRIPTAMDVPADLTCLPVDPNDRACNSVGAKGLGEPATIPTAAAIANAVAHATGIRVVDSPIDPMRLVALLAARERRG
jgi:CO/xanthine dehydrogenase Mo-binding subunit